MKPTPDLDVLERLHALMLLYKRQMHHAAGTADGGLAPMEARALRFFARHPGSTQRDLAQHAMRDKSQVARLVSPLLERGLLAGTPDPTDRRIQRLHLTDKGLAVQHELHQHRQRFEATLVAGLTPEQRELLRTCLDQMLSTAQASSAGNCAMSSNTATAPTSRNASSPPSGA